MSILRVVYQNCLSEVQFFRKREFRGTNRMTLDTMAALIEP
jgi:hypothetical protein